MEHLGLLTVQELKARLDRGEDLVVLDVRGNDEWGGGHIEGATNIHVGQLEKRLNEVPRDRPVAVLCNVGHRAGLGASILLRAGYREVYNVLGSMNAWENAEYLTLSSPLPWTPHSPPPRSRFLHHPQPTSTKGNT